jgi:hypothetical protein
MVPNLPLGGSVVVVCMVVVDSVTFGVTDVFCAAAKTNPRAICMSIRPFKLLWTVICEHLGLLLNVLFT